MATLGLILATYYAWQGNQQKDELQLISAQTRSQQQQYLEVAKNFPSSPIASTELKIATEIAQNIKLNGQSPRQLMLILSNAFEASPEIELTRIRWVQTNDKELKDDADGENNAPTSANQPVAVAVSDPTKLVQIGFINAEIKGFTGDYRAALKSVNQFVIHLRENALVENVLILQEPVNVSSLANLQGSTTDESTSTERPPAIFKLKIILKPINAESAP